MVDLWEDADGPVILQLRAQLAQALCAGGCGITKRDCAGNIHPKPVLQIAIGIVEHDKRGACDRFKDLRHLCTQCRKGFACGGCIGCVGCRIVGVMLGQFRRDDIHPCCCIGRIHPGMRVKPVMAVVMVVMRMSMIVVAVIVMAVPVVIMCMPVVVMRMAVIVVPMVIMSVAVIVVAVPVVIMRVAVIIVAVPVIVVVVPMAIMSVAVIVVAVVIMRMAVIVMAVPVVIICMAVIIV